MRSSTSGCPAGGVSGRRPETAGRDLLVAIGLGLASVLLVLPAARLPDAASGAVAAVFPPGHDATRIYAAIAAADGRPLRTTLGGLVWVARSDEPGFAGRLRRAGALTVLDPVVAAGCLGSGPATGSVLAASGSPGGRGAEFSRAPEIRG